MLTPMPNTVVLHVSPNALLVYNHLRDVGPITRMEAIMQLGVLDLPARIMELRNALAKLKSPWFILSPRVTVGGRTYARYSLFLTVPVEAQ